MRAPSRPLAALLLLGVAAATPRAAAAQPVEATLPAAPGLVLDGKGAEGAWDAAVALPAEAIDGTAPTVRVLLSDGRLFVLAEMKEDVGFPIGVKLLACADGVTSASEAIQLAFAPQEVRAPRYTSRGPKGVGRTVYRVEGAADVSGVGRWTAEVAVPLADLGLASDTTPLRLAVVVASRRMNRFATAPVGSAFASPATFARLLPPAGGWSAAGKAVVDADAIGKADQADEARLSAWREFVGAQRSGGVSAADARTKLLAPLDRVVAARPDLAMAQVVRGNILQELKDEAGARAAYAAALAVVPFLPEAAWAVASLDIAMFSDGNDTTPSDYRAAFARIDEERAKRKGPSIALDAAEGVLRYRLGEFPAAVKLLEPVVAGYPVDDELASKAAFSKKYGPLFAEELGFREADAKRDDLPRVKLLTSKGEILVELFEEDAPNTVANFLWLVKAKFYDGTVFHRVLPYFMAQGGDPLSVVRPEDAGRGGPGYAIRTEASRRRPFRGVLAMASSGKNTEGSQFFLTTGTSAHLDGEFSVFGRILSGQDVVDSLVRGDTLRTVEVVRARDHEYRSKTVGGAPAPAPVPSDPMGPVKPK